MREVPAAMAEALEGSDTTARMICRALYNGEPVIDDLEISSWSLEWRLGDQQTIQGSSNFTIQDPDGELAPWGYDEPLAVGGSRIQAIFECGGESIPLGEWLNISNAPNELWRLTSGGLKFVPGGATVPVSGSDLTQLLADDTFMSPEAPTFGSTVIAEISRLCGDIIGVVVRPDVADKPLPQNMIYEDRMNAVADLAHLIGDYRVNGDGLLEIFNPDRPAKPMWQIRPGPGGALISVNRQQDRTNLFNAVVATGQTDDGAELRAYATMDNGPLRFDGVFGRKPTGVSSLGTTQTAVFADAKKEINSQTADSTTTMVISCTPNPAYEIGDWGAIAQPVIDGSTYLLMGRCTDISFSGGTEGLADMKVSLECATADVLAVARYVRRAKE